MSFTLNVFFVIAVSATLVAISESQDLRNSAEPKEIGTVRNLKAVSSYQPANNYSIRVSWDPPAILPPSPFTYNIFVIDTDTLCDSTSNTGSTYILISRFSPCAKLQIKVRIILQTNGTAGPYEIINKIDSDSTDLKLLHGTYYEGQLSYNKQGQVVGVCGDNIGTETANFVCRTICGTNDGIFYGSVLRSSVHFPLATNFVNNASVSNLQCKGNEDSIQNCPQSNIGSFVNCNVKETASISCFRYRRNGPEIKNEFLNPNITYQVQCLHDEFFLNFSKKENLNYRIEKFSALSSNPECYSSGSDSELHIPFKNCNTSYDGKYFMQEVIARYVKDLVYWPSAANYTRDIRILLLCSPDSYSIEQSFQIDQNPTSTTHILTQTNTSSVKMEAYQDIGLIAPLNLPPVFQLGSSVYIKILIDQPQFLYVSKCYAYPAKNPSYHWSLIDEGCPSELGVSILQSRQQNYAAFRMQTFRFYGFLSDQSAKIQCDIQLCERKDPRAQCNKPCFKLQHPDANSTAPTTRIPQTTTAYEWDWSSRGPYSDDEKQLEFREQESGKEDSYSRRHRRSAEDIILTDSPLQLNEFSLIVLGPRLPDDLPEKIGKNETLTFVGENGATYKVQHGLIFLQSLSKKGFKSSSVSNGGEGFKALFEKMKADRMSEELLLGGALILMTILTLIFACILMGCMIYRCYNRRTQIRPKNSHYGSNEKFAAEYQPLDTKCDDA